jgi:hypothetical protein
MADSIGRAEAGGACAALAGFFGGKIVVVPAGLEAMQKRFDACGI